MLRVELLLLRKPFYPLRQALARLREEVAGLREALTPLRLRLARVRVRFTAIQVPLIGFTTTFKGIEFLSSTKTGVTPLKDGLSLASRVRASTV